MNGKNLSEGSQIRWRLGRTQGWGRKDGRMEGRKDGRTEGLFSFPMPRRMRVTFPLSYLSSPCYFLLTRSPACQPQFSLSRPLFFLLTFFFLFSPLPHPTSLSFLSLSLSLSFSPQGPLPIPSRMTTTTGYVFSVFSLPPHSLSLSLSLSFSPPNLLPQPPLARCCLFLLLGYGDRGGLSGWKNVTENGSSLQRPPTDSERRVLL